MSLKKYNKCLEDSNNCYNLDSNFVKNIKRRAKCYMLMGNLN